MIVLGLDFEATDTDPKVARIMEVGAVLWCTVRNQPMSMHSELVQLPADVELPEVVTKKTGITRDMLDGFGVPLPVAMGALLQIAQKAVACVAHNGTAYDRRLAGEELNRLAWDSDGWGEKFLKMPWIDTMIDIDYPEDMVARRLTHLAADHDFVNPFAHRALPDTLTMLRVAKNYDWEVMLDSASQPVLEVEGLLPYEQRDRLAAAGFRWTGAPRKKWIKNIKAHRFEAFKAQCGFAMTVLPSAS